ncbi:hypothetical protein EVG20_g4811 [Dentipellis fragilis]|uniref:protein-tyrosine-phosphatase n=1 Tax=Dentipellis fragilis TaxID=205917 RepID=A0A4Y9YV25_9AGAM|nr:hypothetical protein EVG20_g4811 [Dentipellis fragilis]
MSTSGPFCILQGELFIGYQDSDLSPLSRTAHGITHIICVCLQSIPESVLRARYRCMRIPVEDSEAANMLPWFQDAVKFIDDAIQSGGTVLVHSDDGITLSRGASVVAAYLIYASRMNVTDALHTVRLVNHYTATRHVFFEQLLYYSVYLDRYQLHA